MWYQKLINEIIDKERTKIAEGANVQFDVGEIEKVATGLSQISVISDAGIVKVAESIRGVAGIARDSINTLRDNAERMQQTIHLYEKTAKVREIVEELVKRGSITSDNVDEKVSELMGKTADDLLVYKQAVDLIGSAEFTGSSFGVLAGNSGGGMNALEEAVLS